MRLWHSKSCRAECRRDTLERSDRIQLRVTHYGECSRLLRAWKGRPRSQEGTQFAGAAEVNHLRIDPHRAQKALNDDLRIPALHEKLNGFLRLSILPRSG